MKIQVTELVENADGSMDIHIELDKDYKDNFKKLYSLKRWSNKKFEEFVIQAIQAKCQEI